MKLTELINKLQELEAQWRSSEKEYDEPNVKFDTGENEENIDLVEVNEDNDVVLY